MTSNSDTHTPCTLFGMIISTSVAGWRHFLRTVHQAPKPLDAHFRTTFLFAIHSWIYLPFTNFCNVTDFSPKY